MRVLDVPYWPEAETPDQARYFRSLGLTGRARPSLQIVEDDPKQKWHALTSFVLRRRDRSSFSRFINVRVRANVEARADYRVWERAAYGRCRSSHRKARRPDFTVRVVSGQILASALSAAEADLGGRHPTAAARTTAAATTATTMPTSGQPASTESCPLYPPAVLVGWHGGSWT